jgi:hypothetical protein
MGRELGNPEDTSTSPGKIATASMSSLANGMSVRM